MQSSPVRDLIVGLFVLGGLAALGYLSFQVGGISYKVPGGFELYATFDDIGGLKERSPISISGVKVGQVASVELDDLLHQASGALRFSQLGRADLSRGVQVLCLLLVVLDQIGEQVSCLGIAHDRAWWN